MVKLFDFVRERHNPYSVKSNVVLPLDNVLTKLAVEKVVAASLLMCLDNGDRVYRSYRQERLVEKIKNTKNYEHELRMRQTELLTSKILCDSLYIFIRLH